MQSKNYKGTSYDSQEKIAKFVFPFLKCYLGISNFLHSKLHIEGILYGLRRAYWRAKIGNLGDYSDISPNVIVKHPKNLTIGIRSCVGAGSFVDAGGGIVIGDRVLISHLVSINSQTHPTSPPYHGLIKKPTLINDDCWIGASSVILEGVEIGRGCIIAAGAVVTKSIPDWTIVGGVPAKIIRSNTPECNH